MNEIRSQEQAFSQAYTFLTQNIQCKLFKQDGQWYCTKVLVPLSHNVETIKWA